MFLAVILICQTLNSKSCTVIANSNNLWYSEAECQADAMNFAMELAEKGFLVKPYCFRLGEGA